MAKTEHLDKAMKRKLEATSTRDLEWGIKTGFYDHNEKLEAERILRERYAEPDRKLARRVYNVAAWTLAFSMGTFIVALITYWLIATANYSRP